MEKRSPRHGIKTPIAPRPSLRPSLLLTHYTRSFSIYTNYRFLQLTIAQTKAVKSFEKMKTSTKKSILLMTKKKKKKKKMMMMMRVMTYSTNTNKVRAFLVKGSSFFRLPMDQSICSLQKKKHVSSWSCSLLSFLPPSLKLVAKFVPTALLCFVVRLICFPCHFFFAFVCVWFA